MHAWQHTDLTLRIRCKYPPQHRCPDACMGLVTLSLFDCHSSMRPADFDVHARVFMDTTGYLLCKYDLTRHFAVCVYSILEHVRVVGFHVFTKRKTYTCRNEAETEAWIDLTATRPVRSTLVSRSISLLSTECIRDTNRPVRHTRTCCNSSATPPHHLQGSVDQATAHTPHTMNQDSGHQKNKRKIKVLQNQKIQVRRACFCQALVVIYYYSIHPYELGLQQDSSRLSN